MICFNKLIDICINFQESKWRVVNIYVIGTKSKHYCLLLKTEEIQTKVLIKKGKLCNLILIKKKAILD